MEVYAQCWFFSVFNDKGLSYRIIRDFDLTNDNYLDMYNLGSKMQQEIAGSGGGGIFSAYLVTESWYVERSNQKISNDLSPSKEADRKKALLIASMTVDGRANNILAPLSKDKKVTERHNTYYKKENKLSLSENLKSFFAGYIDEVKKQGQISEQKGFFCHGYGVTISEEQRKFMLNAPENYFIQFMIIRKKGENIYQFVMHDSEEDKKALQLFSYYCSKVKPGQKLEDVINKELEKIFPKSEYVNYLVHKFQIIDQAKNKEGKVLDRYLIVLEIESDNWDLDRVVDNWYCSWADKEDINKMLKHLPES